MPASRFLKYTGRNWPNPVCSFYLPVSTSRDDPVNRPHLCMMQIFTTHPLDPVSFKFVPLRTWFAGSQHIERDRKGIFLGNDNQYNKLEKLYSQKTVLSIGRHKKIIRWRQKLFQSTAVSCKVDSNTETVILRFSSRTGGILETQELFPKAYFTHKPMYAYLPLFMGSWNMQEHWDLDLF